MAAEAAFARIAATGAAAPVGLKELFRELGDLKRVRSAGRDGSIATRRFRAAWGALARGEAPERVMRRVSAATLAAARLADLDGPTLRSLGLSDREAEGVLTDAFDAVAGSVSEPLRGRLRAALRDGGAEGGGEPPFVAALASQPRAGVTAPGRARIVLEPPENHAEHCLLVAIFGVLLSPAYGADPATVFLASLAHHLHNASLPDSGFAGEVLLGAHLDGVVERATNAALGELAPPLRAAVEEARRILPDAETPEGCAFHAADVIDRVLQIAQHLRAASLSMSEVLDGMDLVHEGPVKPFHDRVLAEMDLP